MQLSLTPFLLAVQLGFVFVLARRSAHAAPSERNMGPVYIYVLWVTAYAVVTGILGARGVYVSEELLKFLPGFWLQLITVAVCVLPIVLFAEVRNGMRYIVDTTPWHWFGYFHGLRILALGTTYKTIIGEFPVYFELLVGVPDFLFGVSAFWIASKTRRGAISTKSFMLWNLIGALIIVPSAPILLQLGLPGPVQVFTSLPDARVVFTYPMSIAPMIGVPLFVLTNLWVAWRLWERTSTDNGV
ncbi:MAG: hypothetical protein ACE5IQ_06470 [Candidatus Methylomirabilales bacterium]